VTAILGMQGYPGILLAADSEETVSGYSKRYVEKIGHWDNPHFRFAIGATGPGHYADLLAGKLGTRLMELKSFSLPIIGKTIENVLVEFHERHVWPRANAQSAEDASVQLLIVVQRTPPQADEQNVFGWSTCETAVNSLDGIPGARAGHNYRTHACIGVGGHLAHYILDRLYRFGNEAQMVTMGAYVMRELNEHIAEVGKEPELTLFRNDGTVDFLVFFRPGRFEDMFLNYDLLQMHLASLITDCGTPTEVKTSEEFFAEFLARVRANAEAVWREKMETGKLLKGA
jgi:hypothetical protein